MRLAAVALCLLLAGCAEQRERMLSLLVDHTQPTPVGYPDAVTPLEPPLRVDLAYRPFAARPFLRRVEWGPAPGELEGLRLRLEAKGTVAAEEVRDGVALTLRREAAVLTVAGDARPYRDAGLLRAAVPDDGRYGETDFFVEGLARGLQKRELAMDAAGLEAETRPPAYRRVINPAGPGDIAAERVEADERRAHFDALRALEPLTGLVLGLPTRPVVAGDEVVLLRRNLGMLFRRGRDMPVTVVGRVKGLAERAGRRVLVVDAARVSSPTGHAYEARGFGLLDIEAGLYLATDVTLRMTAGRGDAERIYLIRDTSRTDG